MKKEAERRIGRIMELIQLRDKCIFELIEILEGRWEKDEPHPVELPELVLKTNKTGPLVFDSKKFDFGPKTQPIKAELDGGQISLEKVENKCTKCEKAAKGLPARGRHNSTCPLGSSKAVTKGLEEEENAPQLQNEGLANEEQEVEKPLEGFSADWVSKCCKSRMVQRSGEEGTNNYECLECFNPCDPAMPEAEREKPFTCEDCQMDFTADTMETVKCPECGTSNVWQINFTYSP